MSDFDSLMGRLAERQQSLAESVQLLHLDVQRHDAVLERLEGMAAHNSEAIDRLSEQINRHDSVLTRLEGINEQNGLLMSQVLDSLAKIGIKVASHEERLRAVEGN